jgi:hypothetical protein
MPLKMLPHLLGHFPRAYLGRKLRTSPFWTDEGKPRVEPRVTDSGDRESLRARVRAAASLPA